VLGSTGSIGTNTLDVIKRHPDLYELRALSAHSRVHELAEQVSEFEPEAVAVTGPAQNTSSIPGADMYRGMSGLLRMLEEVEADVIVNGIAGSPGLQPSFKAVALGRTLALANKETLVMGGTAFLKAARSSGALIIPVDSEHSALFNLMRGIERDAVDELVLTASGGAFRDWPIEKLANARPEDALVHPTWQMGPKITIDSATMANKGLEVIEAMVLFGVDAGRIKVLIHPQSFVHSLVRTREGSLYAQIGMPDMRLPILNALSYPHTVSDDTARLDLARQCLEFAPWDERKYPMLALAYRCARKAGTYPIAYNAADEAAVAAFLEKRIPYKEISRTVEASLERANTVGPSSLEDILEADHEARENAERIIRKATQWRC
jgi:1-deoxy-D-xylulose-5-phosphate reductoisomerase